MDEGNRTNCKAISSRVLRSRLAPFSSPLIHCAWRRWPIRPRRRRLWTKKFALNRTFILVGPVGKRSALTCPCLASSHLSETITVKTSSVQLPLAAALLGARLQGHSMDSKVSPLQKAGYDYGDTLRGTGEGWGHFTTVSNESDVQIH